MISMAGLMPRGRTFPGRSPNHKGSLVRGGPKRRLLLPTEDHRRYKRRMRCVKCGSENPSGTKFCGECGTPVEHLCPHCGFANLPLTKFCRACGVALGAAGQATRVQR